MTQEESTTRTAGTTDTQANERAQEACGGTFSAIRIDLGDKVAGTGEACFSLGSRWSRELELGTMACLARWGGQGGPVERAAHVAWWPTSENEPGIIAALIALRFAAQGHPVTGELPGKIVIHTTSQTLHSGITTWGREWREKGWPWPNIEIEAPSSWVKVLDQMFDLVDVGCQAEWMLEKIACAEIHADTASAQVLALTQHATAVRKVLARRSG